VVILLLLFLIQRFGTNKVSASFSPIMLAWFGSIAMIGVYNIARHYPPVLKAVSPHYVYYYFARNKKVGWEQLGAIILCITGEGSKLHYQFIRKKGIITFSLFYLIQFPCSL
jgi:KUP system potassium uptake protein